MQICNEIDTISPVINNMRMLICTIYWDVTSVMFWITYILAVGCYGYNIPKW